jgi:hypothetical protein
MSGKAKLGTNNIHLGIENGLQKVEIVNTQNATRHYHSLARCEVQNGS